MDGTELWTHVGMRRVAVAFVGLAVAGLAAGYGVSVRARPKTVRVPLGSPSAEPGGKGAAASAGKLIFVHVAGAVQSPGLYEVADGARVADALRAAGGPLENADLDAVNLATKVRDGDKVQVPVRGPPGASGQSPASAGSVNGRVNLNTATESDLDGLPGVGPAIAKRIVTYRQEHGGFRSVRDLMKVPGIGAKKFAELEDLVTV